MNTKEIASSFCFKMVYLALKYFVVILSTIAFCEDGEDQIGCSKISLVFILDCVLNNIYASSCHSIPNVLPY